MRLILPAVFLFIQFISYGQIDQNKIDSLSKAIDSTAKLYQQRQDSIIKTQDSVYQSSIHQSPGSVNHSLAEQKRGEVNATQKVILSAAVAALLLAVFIFLLIKRKQSKL